MNEHDRQLIGGKYRLMEPLGSGGAGKVYRAIQLPLERIVAIKLLKPSLGRDPATRRRFAREARSVATLNHPNISIIYDFGLAENDVLYIAMEFVDGQGLRSLIEEGLPTIPALFIAEQILSGLGHAHARGLIHRDLKPGNILVSRIDNQIRCKIVDFGIASVVGHFSEDDKSVASRGKVIGTPRYMSPEQAQGERNLTFATDIYNVGLVLYELSTGRHPFLASTPQAMMVNHCTAPVPRPLPRPGFQLPEALEQIISTCLAKNPADRFASAADARDAIADVRRSLEDSGHALYMPVAPIVQGEAEGRITLVEGTPRVVAAQPAKLSSALDIPLVGRQADRDFLTRRAQQVRDTGRGSIVIVEGESGIGKTRLVTWLKEQLVEDSSMRALAGRYVREDNQGLRGLREALDQLFTTGGLDAPQTSARVASQMVSWNLTDARDAGRVIDLLRPQKDSTDISVSANIAEDKLLAAICRVLAAAAESIPTMLLLDDIQWSGTRTADFLALLSAELRSKRLPLLVVCTLRSEDLPRDTGLAANISDLAVYHGDVVFRRRIGRMPADELGLLLQHVLPMHESLTSALVRRAEGNPLYALQVLRYLVDQDMVQPTDTGVYVTDENVRVNEVVPPNLADLLLMRLVQLERNHPTGRPLVAVLERAAILGSRFPYDALAFVVAHENEISRDDLDRVVDDLIDQNLLVQAPDQAEDLLDFGHGLIRDVLLKRMAPRRSTRLLHDLAAQAKQAYFADRVEMVAHQLAAHYELGRNLTEALRFTHLAGVTAEKTHSPSVAITSWRRFVRLYSRVDKADRDALELPTLEEIQVRLAELQEALGRYDEADLTFRSLVPNDDQPLTSEPAIRAVIGLGAISLRHGHATRADQRFARALAAARVVGARSCSARAMLGLAQVAWHHGLTEEAMAQGQRARDDAQKADNPRGQAHALWFLGDVGRLTGDLANSERRFREALTIFESSDDPRGVARCLYGLAFVARSKNNLDQAERLYQRALETLKPLGVRRGLAHCLNGLGEVARFRNRLSEAREFYRRAVDLYQSAGLATDAAVSLTNLGLVDRDAGDLQGARDAMERALRVAEAAGYRYLTLGIALNLAWVYALLGERQLCEKNLDEHLDKALKYGLVDPDFARPLEGIAGLLDAAGDSSAAERLYEHAREMWEEMRRDRDASRVAALLR